MSKIRVYSLSKEIGLSNKALIEELTKLGVSVKSHSSSIDEETAEIIRGLFKKDDDKTKNVSPEEKAETTTVKEEIKPKVEKEEIEQKEVKEKKEEIKSKEAAKVKSSDKTGKHTRQKSHTKPNPQADKTQNEQSVGKVKLKIQEAMTVKELSDEMGISTGEVIKKMMGMGVMATVNQLIDKKMALAVVAQFGFEIEKEVEELDDFFSEEKDDPSKLKPRYPMVTIMGHVDHGKTTLLDSIRATRVSEGEAGGITQHIGAYEVDIDESKIIFLDTPGHEAFTAMRARGAKVTDIVILVVAADDGVMPQTVEALHHAKAAEVPIIVAVNKMDKPGANPDRVKQELSKIDPDLAPDDWGGKTIYVNVSAKAKTGIDDLLEMIQLQAEILELKANPDCPAKGTIIEAKLDKGTGAVATIMIQKGTLRIGESFVVGHNYGRVRALLDYKGKKISEAGPSIPVEVLGISGVPLAGDIFAVIGDEKKARQIALVRSQNYREAGLKKIGKRITLEELHQQITEGKIKELNLIIKADVQGSVETLSDSLLKIGNKDVGINILHSSVGGVTESDVMLAAASSAIIIAFNIEPSDKSVELALKENVEIKKYNIIYQIISDIKLALEGMLEPTEVEKIIGKAEVREVFNVSKTGAIAGVYVTTGSMRKNLDAKLIRDSVIIYQGKISSLRRFKEDVREVLTGFECGIGLEKFNDIKVGDVIEPVIVEKIARKL